MKYLTFVIAVGFAVFYLSCSNPTETSGGTSDNGNALVFGHIFNPDFTPAQGANVRFVPVGYNPRMAGAAKIDSTLTDQNGYYSLLDLAAGTYNVLASGTRGSAFRGSVNITDTTEVGSDTLQAPGNIRGVVKLVPPVDSAMVFVILLGTNTYCMADTNGEFVLDGLGRGSYRALVLSTAADYGSQDTVWEVRPGETAVLEDTVELTWHGIPEMAGFSVRYDTLLQIVHLYWAPVISSGIKGVNIYRTGPDSVELELGSAIIDTFFIDKSCRQDQIYSFSAAVVDFNGQEGIRTENKRVLICSGFPFIRTVGTNGVGESQYEHPLGVSVSKDGKVFVADHDSGKILVYDTAGVYCRNYHGFRSPSNVVAHENDGFYVVEMASRYIKVVDSTGLVLFQFGGTGTGAGEFSDISPRFFTISQGLLYIPDFGGNRIQTFDLTGLYLSSYGMPEPASIAVFHDLKIAVGSNTNVTILNSDFSLADEWEGVFAFISCVTRNGNLAVATVVSEGPVSVQKIMIYSETGLRLGLLGSWNHASDYYFQSISGLAMDGNNHLYIADGGRKIVSVFGLPDSL